jgi:ribonuclease HI
MSKKQKYYVVWAGRNIGIFTTWDDCRRSVEGYPDARYKSFESKEEAESAFKEKPAKHLYAKKAASPTVSSTKKFGIGKPLLDSICVDAACSGNPGNMEYQGVDTQSNENLFHMGPYYDGTNNVGEFLSLVHALAYLHQKNYQQKLYIAIQKLPLAG